MGQVYNVISKVGPDNFDHVPLRTVTLWPVLAVIRQVNLYRKGNVHESNDAEVYHLVEANEGYEENCLIYDGFENRLDVFYVVLIINDVKGRHNVAPENVRRLL